MLAFLIEILAELLLQIIVEILAELGLRIATEPFRKPPNPWLAAIGYAIFGAASGGISLLVLPNSLVHEETWRLINLAITPALAGLTMAAIGAWRTRHGQHVLRIDRFSYGYLFAFSMTIVRFHFAT